MKISRSLLIALGLAVGAAAALAYSLNGYRWRNNTAVSFSLRFGTNGVATPFQDGTTSFDQVAEQAISLWNNYLGSGVRIVPVREGQTGSVTYDNSVNEAAFRVNPFSNQSWGDAIAITYGVFEDDGATFKETDIIFRQGYKWNSYRGALQLGSSPANTTFEFRRVAIHEFGHALGLDHPDDHGQTVTAIMNSVISDVDVMQLDDINGVQAIYGRLTPTPTPTPTPFPPGYVTPTPTPTPAPSPTPTRVPTPTPFPTWTPTPTPTPTRAPVAVSGAASLTFVGDPSVAVFTGQAREVTTASGLNVSVRIVSTEFNGGSAVGILRKLGYALDFTGPEGTWFLTLLPPDPRMGQGASDNLPPPLVAGEYPMADPTQPSAQNFWQKASGLFARSTNGSDSYMGLSRAIIREVRQAADGSIESLALDFTAESPGFSVYLNPAVSGSVRIASSVPIPRPGLVNVSTRLRIGSGDQSGIAGFVVGGTGKKILVLRSVGPSLAAAGIAQPLADPAFDLFDATGRRLLRATNFLGPKQPQAPVINDSPAGFAMMPISFNEVAIAVQLDPGAYTIVASPETGAAGVGLVEVYEYHRGESSRPINISTRGMVGTGDEVMIAGFIVQDTKPKRVIIRALGPSLAAAGVAGTLANPRLELRNSAGELMMENDDWRSGAQAVDIQAFGRAPGDDHEAAIIATLPTGSYTAIVRGVGDTTGVALVEVYDLDPP